MRAQLAVVFDDTGEKHFFSMWSKEEKDFKSFEITTAFQRSGIIWYFFLFIEEGGGKGYLGPSPGKSGGEAIFYEEEPQNHYQLTVYRADFTTPNWFSEGVTYHVFVDRFFRGGREDLMSLDERYTIHKSMEDIPDWKPDKKGKITNMDIFGGDLLGVIQKLPYLKSLGVKTIYLSPVFEASSNHKYNTGDYCKIDPHFGTTKDLADLCKEAKKQDMAVILDGVFNHTGSDSRYFNKEGRYEEEGAYQTPASRYYKWYRFSKYPDRYDCWWGIDTLPSVNELETSFLNFITEGEESVIARWMAQGVAGWRLDVADELPDLFIEKLRERVRKSNASGLLIGEVWEDASNKISYGVRRSYLLGKGLDGVINYPAREAIISFVTGTINAGEFVDRILSLQENYPPCAFASLMNILGTHDTERILTVLGIEPDQWKMPKEEKAVFLLDSEKRELAIGRLKMAALLQYLLPGSPCLYYGDEAGMEGFEDPFNRRFFPWGKEDKEMLKWYRILGALKRQNSALHKGKMTIWAASAEVVMLTLAQGEKKVWGIVNRGISPYQAFGYLKGRINCIGGKLLAKEEQKIQVEIASMSCAIFYNEILE